MESDGNDTKFTIAEGGKKKETRGFIYELGDVTVWKVLTENVHVELHTLSLSLLKKEKKGKKIIREREWKIYADLW